MAKCELHNFCLPSVLSCSHTACAVGSKLDLASEIFSFTVLFSATVPHGCSSCSLEWCFPWQSVNSVYFDQQVSSNHVTFRIWLPSLHHRPPLPIKLCLWFDCGHFTPPTPPTPHCLTPLGCLMLHSTQKPSGPCSSCMSAAAEYRCSMQLNG